MEWFSDWFDSKYYHILYKDRNLKEAKEFINNLSHLTYFKNSSKIIDIACGKGRHSILLSNLGYNVTGIDLSEQSIAYAKKSESKNLNFHISDMRNINYNNSFDIALNLFTSFGYFENKEDNNKSIASFAKCLKKDGVLIIDFLNAQNIKSNLIKHEKKTCDEITFEINRKIKNNHVYKRINFNDNGHSFNFEERVELLSLDNFSDMLIKNNMKIINTFGDYHLNPFNLNTSKRLIIVSKKDL